MSANSLSHYVQRLVKRGLDVILAILCLAALSPLLGAIALVVLIRMGRPILFRQIRPGKDGIPFTLYKFRTMREAHIACAEPSSDKVRLTSLGRFLRRFSLDEIPQLVNVIRGDLSLVGPRPLLMDYLPLYTPEQARRHEVRPGITGWAQINGRNAISWEEKFALDLWYIDHWSLWLDLRILARTVLQVIRGRGISSQDSATMPVFTGTPESTR